MPELQFGTTGRFQVQKGGPNPLDPELLSPDERLAEVGALLALGLLRDRVRAAGRRETCPPSLWREHLAIPAASSDSCPEPSSGGRET